MAKPKTTLTGSPKPATPAKVKKEREPKVITENRKARHEFEILETLECGIMLTGSEVKSLRDGKISLEESYARIKEGDLWLLGADIPEYKQASIFNHKPKRPRKLLVHKLEFRKFAQRAKEKGLTLVPLKFFFNERGIAKVLLGLSRGKKLHDKRETLKNKDAKRDIARAVRRER